MTSGMTSGKILTTAEIISGDYKGYIGVVTRTTRENIVWIKVKTNWGNHHHPKKYYTLKVNINDVKFL